MKLLLFYLLLQYHLVYSKDIDYINANINKKNYQQVPKNVLIVGKYQAYGPGWLVEGELRGYGYEEAYYNTLINQLRLNEATIGDVYVDYFTVAKHGFYRNNDGYEICSVRTRPFKQMKIIAKDQKINNYKYLNKYLLYSKAYAIQPHFGILAFRKKNSSRFDQFYFDNSKIINIRKLMNDESFKTIQVTNSAGVVREIAYTFGHGEWKLIPSFKKRVYDFVSSNAVQITEMLKHDRMDWADFTFYGDYYAQKLNYMNDFTFVHFLLTPIHELTMDDLNTVYVFCVSENLSKLKKVMKIINTTIIKYRTNEVFWDEVSKKYTEKLKISPLKKEEMFSIKENFNYKTQLDQGIFDIFSIP